ncbi:MAG TPA: MMPL family transporter [Candidatus Dormibacteraeota bacterium]|nr:MMPL family transporter [Candidatus Dormibacteraeota bacterium]
MSVGGRARRSVESVGELTELFGAALRGAARRPFYWQEFLEQCRFILTANFIPLLLTGLGFGTIVSLEAGNFFKARYSSAREGGAGASDASSEASLRVGPAIVASGAALVIGFAVLAVSPVPMVRDFGLWSAADLALATGAVLVLLPPVARRVLA